MNNHANITQVEELPGDFYLLHLTLDEATPGELITFTDFNYKTASLPTNQTDQRKILCRSLHQLKLNDLVEIEIKPLPNKPFDIIIGEDNGISAAISLAKHNKTHKPFVLLSSSTTFPFHPQPSKTLIANLPAGVIAASPLLDDWGIPNRLVCQAALPGCFHGNASNLLDTYLADKNLENFSICLVGSENFINNKSVHNLRANCCCIYLSD